MNDTGGGPPPAGSEDQRIQLLIAEYEFARDNRNHGDATEWEMTAIVWGAQTLPLGFILEAISNIKRAALPKRSKSSSVILRSRVRNSLTVCRDKPPRQVFVIQLEEARKVWLCRRMERKALKVDGQPA
jgi:hypothetical protein